MADTFSFPDYNMPGFPYANLPAQLAALFVPPNLQFTNGSQYGRWNGVNANAFGLFPNQFQPLFAPPVTPSSVFQPPWGNNGYIGSNQGPGSNPGGLPPPSLPGGQPPQSGSPPPTNPPPSSQPSGFPPLPPGGSLYGNGPMVPPAGSQGGLLPPYLPPMTGVPPAGYGSPPPTGSSSLPPPPSGTITPPMASQQKMAMATGAQGAPLTTEDMQYLEYIGASAPGTNFGYTLGLPTEYVQQVLNGMYPGGTYGGGMSIVNYDPSTYNGPLKPLAESYMQQRNNEAMQRMTAMAGTRLPSGAIYNGPDPSYFAPAGSSPAEILQFMMGR